jgi:hypothetical protein
MDQLGTYVGAAIILGAALGFMIGRLNRRLAHKADVTVVGMSAIEHAHRPELEGTVGLTVAVPRGALRRTRIGDTVSVFLR